MGADIHIHVEIKHNGKWKYSDKGHFTPPYSYEKEKSSSPFDWRSYRMFSVLAGVRGGDIKPIKETSYELPDDISEYVKSEWERWEGDGHSKSYLTARELVEFDFNQDIITIEQSPRNSRNVLFEKLILESKDSDEDDERPEKTYYDYIGGPNSIFFTHIRELTELGELDDVRIVFWFDN